MRYSYNEEEAYAKVVGKRIVAVSASSDRADLKLDDGQTLGFELEGDCCSHSYYTDTAQFDELVGGVIQAIEERHGGSEEHANDDSTSWHFLVIVTDKGHTTIDWRNDSNGYYDGRVIVHLD